MKNELDSQLARLQAVGVRKSQPFLKNQHAFSIVSLQVQLQTCVNIQLQTGGGQEVPTLFEESVRQSACVSSVRGGQEVQCSQLAYVHLQCAAESACTVHLQVQTVGVRKSRPFLKNQ